MRTVPLIGLLSLVLVPASAALAMELEKPPGSIRVATYNVSFYRDREGQLLEDLERGDKQARSIAEVVQRVKPDLLLLNEFDYSQDGKAIEVFCTKYLAHAQRGETPIEFAHNYFAPVNTGVPSGFDLDGDEKSDGPGDAYGYGRYPGQYGMVLLSQFPIEKSNARTFQSLLWKNMEGNHLPTKLGSSKSYYDKEVLDIFRLSSKSHWDVPVEVELGDGKYALHMLCSHPTPPVFDGPEDRNGRRNYDEIQFWYDYLCIDSKSFDYIIDDGGKRGGLAPTKSFVVLGDLNADPVDGDARRNMEHLLDHRRVNSDFTPSSEGAAQASEKKSDLNRNHKGEAKFDTADFSGDGHGNLRVDYVLPSRDLKVLGSGVYWPKEGEPGSEAIRATDHRLVWVDLAFPPHEGEANGGDTN